MWSSLVALCVRVEHTLETLTNNTFLFCSTFVTVAVVISYRVIQPTNTCINIDGEKRLYNETKHCLLKVVKLLLMFLWRTVLETGSTKNGCCEDVRKGNRNSSTWWSCLCTETHIRKVLDSLRWVEWTSSFQNETRNKNYYTNTNKPWLGDSNVILT